MDVYAIIIKGRVTTICEDRITAMRVLSDFIKANLSGQSLTTALAFLRSSYNRGSYKFEANKDYIAECFPILTFEEIWKGR